jgi:DtxR family Mn-dependent transcriptional regulator
MYTFTEENYLKAIYHLSDSFEKGVSTNAIAERLDTKPASVTDMLKKLSDKKLLVYKKYQGVSLTAEGTAVAIRTVRKHRLWEVFLVKKLEFGWEEVHEIAEQLEHIQSTKLTDKLDEFLAFPKYDPHGDPIPNKDGIFPNRSDQTLTECNIGETAILKGVKDTDPEFLKYLKKLNLTLGEELLIKEKESYDHSMMVELSDRSQINLSQQVSGNLYVTVK